MFKNTIQTKGIVKIALLFTYTLLFVNSLQAQQVAKGPNTQNWTSISVSGNVQKIAFNNQIGIAVGDNGLILKTTDDGIKFSQISSGVNDNLVDIKYIGNNSFIACGWIWGSHGVVLKSNDNGNTWNSVVSLGGHFNEMFGIFNFNSDTIFVSGTNQLIKTYNGFNSYSTSYFPNGYQYRSLLFNNNLILMAHAGSVIMRKSNDFGASYTNSSIQPTSNLLRDMILYNLNSTNKCDKLGGAVNHKFFNNGGKKPSPPC
jgi:hypothetical protein